MGVGRVLRIGGAVALLVAGLVHLDLYFGGYRDAGSVPSFGRSILFNAIASGVLAALVAARREWYVRLAGIILPVASLAALAYTHTEHTLFGFQGDGLNPSPQAQIVLVAEIAAIVLLALTFVPSIAARDQSSGFAAVGAAGVVVAGVLIGFGAYWAGEDTQSAGATGPGAVSIANFAFSPDPLEVPAGTAVTWTNNDDIDHSVVADDDAFRSDPLGNGSSYEFTFDEAGQYSYVCGIHPEMSGTVIVSG